MCFTVQDFLWQKDCRNAAIVVVLHMSQPYAVVVLLALRCRGYCFLFFQELLSHGRQDRSWLLSPARPPQLLLIVLSTGKHFKLPAACRCQGFNKSEWLTTLAPGWFSRHVQFSLVPLRKPVSSILPRTPPVTLETVVTDTLSLSSWLFATETFCCLSFPVFDLPFNK